MVRQQKGFPSLLKAVNIASLIHCNSELSKNALKNKKKREKQREKKAAESGGSGT